MIVYIHGASATAESFTHIRQFVRDYTEESDVALEYNSEAGFDHNLAEMKGQLDDADRLFFVSNRLGGIYHSVGTGHVKWSITTIFRQHQPGWV